MAHIRTSTDRGITQFINCTFPYKNEIPEIYQTPVSVDQSNFRKTRNNLNRKKRILITYQSKFKSKQQNYNNNINNNNKLFSSMYKQTALFYEVYIYILERPSKGKQPSRKMPLGSSSNLLAYRGGGRG